MWNKKYAKCIICGTTNRKHKAHGKCYYCYNRPYQPKGARKHWYSKRYGIDIDKTFLLKECFFCKASEDLLIHHKDLDKKNNSGNNFVTLCRKCHTNLHSYIRLKKIFDKTSLVAPNWQTIKT